MEIVLSCPFPIQELIMKPFAIDESGAILVPYEDRAPLEDPFLVGHHDGCTGKYFENRFEVHYHSPSHNCLVCQRCHLRILVKNDVLPLVITPEVFEPLRKRLIQMMEQKRLAKQIMQYPGLYQVLLASTIDA